MSDTTILMTGVVVFSLMLAAMVLTVIEFKQIGKDQKSKRRNSRVDSGNS